MIISDLLKSIKNKSVLKDFGKILIFTGEEGMLKNVYCKEIGKALKSKVVFADEDYLSIKKAIENNSPLNNSGIYVLRNSNDFLNNEELINQAKTNIASNKLLILIYDKIDKRKAFFKDNEKITCEFNKMTTPQLTRVIKKQLDLNDDNCTLLCSLINNDYGRLLSELNKLTILVENNKDIEHNELFAKAIKEDVIYRECNDVSFNLIDAILQKRIPAAFNYLSELKRWDDDPFKFMGLIYSYLKNMLMLKASNNININPYIQTKLKQNIFRFSINELMNDLDILLMTEQGIKSGKIDSNISLDYALTKILLGG